jgi:hypothetical protein
MAYCFDSGKSKAAIAVDEVEIPFVVVVLVIAAIVFFRRRVMVVVRIHDDASSFSDKAKIMKV